MASSTESMDLDYESDSMDDIEQTVVDIVMNEIDPDVDMAPPPTRTVSKPQTTSFANAPPLGAGTASTSAASGSTSASGSAFASAVAAASPAPAPTKVLGVPPTPHSAPQPSAAPLQSSPASSANSNEKKDLSSMEQHLRALLQQQKARSNTASGSSSDTSSGPAAQPAVSANPLLARFESTGAPLSAPAPNIPPTHTPKSTSAREPKPAPASEAASALATKSASTPDYAPPKTLDGAPPNASAVPSEWKCVNGLSRFKRNPHRVYGSCRPPILRGFESSRQCLQYKPPRAPPSQLSQILSSSSQRKPLLYSPRASSKPARSENAGWTHSTGALPWSPLFSVREHRYSLYKPYTPAPAYCEACSCKTRKPWNLSLDEQIKLSQAQKAEAMVDELKAVTMSVKTTADEANIGSLHPDTHADTDWSSQFCTYVWQTLLLVVMPLLSWLSSAWWAARRPSESESINPPPPHYSHDPFMPLRNLEELSTQLTREEFAFVQNLNPEDMQLVATLSIRELKNWWLPDRMGAPRVPLHEHARGALSSVSERASDCFEYAGEMAVAQFVALGCWAGSALYEGVTRAFDWMSSWLSAPHNAVNLEDIYERNALADFDDLQQVSDQSLSSEESFLNSLGPHNVRDSGWPQRRPRYSFY